MFLLFVQLSVTGLEGLRVVELVFQFVSKLGNSMLEFFSSFQPVSI